MLEPSINIWAVFFRSNVIMDHYPAVFDKARQREQQTNIIMSCI